MSLVPNPWVIVGVLIALSASFFYGTTVGRDHAVAAQVTAEHRDAAVEAAAQKGAAAAIAANKPINQYRTQVLEHETRVVPDYSRCVHSDDSLRALNADLEHRSLTPGAGVVPDADQAD